MSEVTKFIVHEGIPELISMFWSSDSSPVTSKRGSTVNFYGNNKKYPIICHIRVRDLFITGSKTKRVHKGARIVIDLFPFNMAKEYLDKMANDIEGIDKDFSSGKIEHFGTIELQLEQMGNCDIDPSDPNKGIAKIKTKLLAIDGSEKDVEVTVQSIGKTVLNQRYDISFELPLSDDELNQLDEISDKNEHLLAWCWIVTDSKNVKYSTIKQYKDIFGIDISNEYDRINTIADPESKRFKGFQKSLKFWKEYSSRFEYEIANEYITQDADDPFPFDEPALNYLKVSKSLPFKHFIIGKQLGQVGLVQMNKNYFHNSIKKSQINLYGNNGYELLETDNYYYHGLDSGEYTTAGEDRFFYRESSAAHWINSIEKRFVNSQDVNGIPSDITQKPFKTGPKYSEVELEFHNYTVSYSQLELELHDYTSSESGENSRGKIDLSEYSTITIPETGWKHKNTQDCYLRIGKGFPSKVDDEKFIGTAHNNVTLEGDSDPWQVHTICHRPVFVSYELERDLSDEEITKLKNNPLRLIIQLHFDGTFESPPKVDKVCYILRTINNEACTKKGKHLVLLYLTFIDNGRIPQMVNLSVIPENPNLDIKDYNQKTITPRNLKGYEKFGRGVKFKPSLLKTFLTYQPDKMGLFNDNPIILVDDIQESELRKKAIENAKKEFNNTVNKEVGKFLTSFIPVVGDVAGATLEVVVDSVDGKKPSAIKSAQLGYSIINTFVTESIKKNPASDPVTLTSQAAAKAKLKGAGNVLKFAATIDALVKAKKKLDKTIILQQHPFLKGDAFGEEGDEYDSLYLISVKEITRKLLVDSASNSISFSINTESNKAAFIMNRHIDHKNTSVGFHYQFGDIAGLLERDDSGEKDSISPLRTAYQKKIGVFKQKIESITNETAGTMVNKLASGNHLQDLLDDNKIGLNPDLVKWVKEKGIKALLLSKLKNTKKFTMKEAVDITTFIKLIQYIDASFIICPACDAPVSLSYGWCPYHATEGMLNLQDIDGSGSLKEEFIEYLEGNVDYNDDGNPTIVDVLNKEIFSMDKKKRKNRLLVHWTEFLVVK